MRHNPVTFDVEFDALHALSATVQDFLSGAVCRTQATLQAATASLKPDKSGLTFRPEGARRSRLHHRHETATVRRRARDLGAPAELHDRLHAHMHTLQAAPRHSDACIHTLQSSGAS